MQDRSTAGYGIGVFPSLAVDLLGWGMLGSSGCGLPNCQKHQEKRQFDRSWRGSKLCVEVCLSPGRKMGCFRA